VAGDAAPTRLGISVGGRLDRLTIEISAQEFGARAYIRTRFSYSTNGSFWAGFTYDAYCEAADSASDITYCVKLNNRQADLRDRQGRYRELARAAIDSYFAKM
jgi:hypothetical protein